MNKEKPEALQLAEKLRDAINMLECNFQEDIDTDDLKLAAMELESLHASVQELEAKEAKPAAPVVWPEPVAAQSRFVPALSDGWGFCSVAQARLFARENYEVRVLYTRAQVEAMLEAQGVKL